MERQTRATRILYLIFVLVGLAAIVPGVHQWDRDREFARQAATTEAVTVGYSSDLTPAERRKTYVTEHYARELEYTVDGRTYSHKETSYKLTDIPSLGEKVTIFYDPEHPSNSTTEPSGDRQIGLAIVLSGAFWAAIWAAVLWRGRTATRK